MKYKRPKPINFWKHGKQPATMKGVSPQPKLKLPKTNLGKEGMDLAKTGVGLAIGFAALGLGLAAYQSVAK